MGCRSNRMKKDGTLKKATRDNGGIVLLIACALNLLAVSTVFMTQSIFLEISETFAIEVTRARFSFTTVSLFYAAAFLFLGPAADKFDLPKMAVSGGCLLAAAVWGASYAASYPLFIIAMAFTGIFAALIPAALFPFIVKAAPKSKTGLYMGTIVASGTLGVIFGRAFTGLLTAIVGWPISFRIVALVLLLLSAPAFHVLVKGYPASETKPVRLAGMSSSFIQLLFIPRVAALLLTGFSLFFGFLGMVTFLTYRLIAPPFNFSSGAVGWISFAGMTALIAPFAGYLSQRVGAYRILLPGLLICLLSFQLMGWSQSIPLIVLGLLLLFLGVYACQPVLFLLIGQSAPQASLGSASSLYILFCIGSGSLSSFLLGPVWLSYGWHGITVTCSLALLLAGLIVLVAAWQERRWVRVSGSGAAGMQIGG